MSGEAPNSGARVEKVMALSPGEFATTIAALAPAGPTAKSVQVPLGSGSVAIRYEALPGVRLGGLLELPRASVTLTFDNVSEAEREAFVRRFDVAFQRGGG